MKGKRVDVEGVRAAVGQFLATETHLAFGFAQNAQGGIRHQVQRTGADGLVLFNPHFDVNGLLYLRRFFSKDVRVLAILRPCEIRAYIELSKLTQVERTSIIAVSVDCFGSVSGKEDAQFPPEPTALKSALEACGTLRYACTLCREPRGVVGDAGIRVDAEGKLWAQAFTPVGDEFLGLVSGEPEEMPDSFMLAGRGSGERFQSDMQTFSTDFAKCIMCMNCRDVCPVCYCIDCVFQGNEYVPKGDAFINKVLRLGDTALPFGKELFHLIRMYHVSQTCVGCGACEEACPQRIPVTKYMKGTSERLQALFSYMSGRSFDEPIPYLTFEEDELKHAED